MKGASVSFFRRHGWGTQAYTHKPCVLATGTPNSAHELEKVCFLHDTKKLLFVDFAITIAVRLIDHFLQFFVGHPLAKLLCHALQVLEGDLARLVIIEEPEGLQ